MGRLALENGTSLRAKRTTASASASPASCRVAAATRQVRATTDRVGGQRTRINGIAVRRASGSIFTSVRPSGCSRRQTRCHTAARYTHTRTRTQRRKHTVHTRRYIRSYARRGESAHERRSRGTTALTRAAPRRRSRRVLPGTRLRLGKFYIFRRRVVSIFTVGDFNIQWQRPSSRLTVRSA